MHSWKALNCFDFYVYCHRFSYLLLWGGKKSGKCFTWSQALRIHVTHLQNTEEDGLTTCEGPTFVTVCIKILQKKHAEYTVVTSTIL